MTAGLAFGVTAVVLAVIGLGAYLFFIHHRDRLVDAARATARLQSDLIRAALEHQMMENDRTLIRQMLQTFARDPAIRQVLVLDRTGRPQHASRPVPPGTRFALDEPTCRICHAHQPVRRDSAVIETEGGSVLRSVLPIENRPACHACHDPRNRINGVLIVDMATGASTNELAGDLRWMTIGGGLLALCLLAAIAVVMRIVVHRRLNRFEETARAIALGDLRRRVPVAGNDTLSWLGREFNDMADTAERLLDDLRGQQQRLETVINSVDDGIVVLDRNLRVVAANDAFLQRAGKERAAVVGKPCRDVAATLCASADCPGLSCFESAERFTSIIARTGPDGRTRHEEVRSSPVRGAGGEVAFAVEVWRDITGRRAEEARMAEAHRLASLGMLASGFSHELNTPLASVLTCVEGILRTVEGKEAAAAPGASDVAESARIAREQLLRCRAVTQHFLRMSRGQNSTTDILELGPLVAAVVRLVEPTARELGVTVLVEPTAGPVSVRAGDAQLQQVLLNLILNGMQACPRGGTVRVSVSNHDRVHIRVQDDGRGIAPEHLTRIFEPFFSLRPGGTGLGLFLSQNLVRGWGGEISVASEPGKGTTFEVAFPAAASKG